jgi:hypothetical protein
MDRRSFLGAATAAAVVGSGLVGAKSGWAEDGAVVGGPPANLLASTFEALKGALVARVQWDPMPKASDRAGWGALPADVREALVKTAEKANTGEWPMLLATDELEFKRTGNRSHFEGLSFGRRTRLGELVLGECVEGKGRFLDQIANGVWLICEETFWGAQAHLGAQKAGVGLADEAEPIIELFSAETVATLSWVVYLLGDELKSVSPLIVPRIEMEAKRRVLDPYAVRNDFWWMGLSEKSDKHLNNWNPWINSNVLTAVLVLEPEGPRRGELVEKVCRSVDKYLADYSPDAGCEEGPGYWSRSAASFFDVCSTLVSAHGGKGDGVLTHPFTRAMGHYIENVHISKNNYVNFGDAHVHASPEAEELFRFGSGDGDDSLKAFGAFLGESQRVKFSEGGVASLSRELGKVWTVAPMREAKGVDALPRDAWYPKLGLMTARQTEGSSDGFYVALQAASNGRPHGHNDSGSFLVFYDGEPVFIDVGVGQYTAQTFSKDRYKIWSMQSQFHNLPEIGGVGEREGYGFQASGLRYAKSDAATAVSANLATAYPKEAGVKRWMRTVTLDRAAKKVVVEEEFALANPAEVKLTLMCAQEPVVSAGEVKTAGVVVGFDAGQLTAVAEKIALTDALFRESWGEAVWRVRLTSKSVAKGSWKMEMRGA